MSKPLKWSLAVVLCLIWVPITSAFSDWIGGTFLNEGEAGALFTGIITACFLSLGYLPLIRLYAKRSIGIKNYGATPASSVGGLKNWLLSLSSDKAESELAFDDSPTNDDDQLYEQALVEIENNTKVKSLWARAFASSDNKEDAERLYITLRVDRLREEHTNPPPSANNPKSKKLKKLFLFTGNLVAVLVLIIGAFQIYQQKQEEALRLHREVMEDKFLSEIRSGGSLHTLYEHEPLYERVKVIEIIEYRRLLESIKRQEEVGFAEAYILAHEDHKEQHGRSFSERFQRYENQSISDLSNKKYLRFIGRLFEMAGEMGKPRDLQRLLATLYSDEKTRLEGELDTWDDGYDW